MTKFLFENKDGKAFKACSGEEMKLVVDAKPTGYCEIMQSGGRWFTSDARRIFLDRVYRVLAPEPTPNEIDWSMLPPEYKYLYGNGMLTTRLPVEERQFDGGLCLGLPGSGRFMQVSEGNFGFRRGTVESIDSLLIRPIGE